MALWAIVAAVGAIVMVDNVALGAGGALTVRFAVPLIPLEVAVIVAELPPVTPVATPLLLIETAVLFDDQVATVVKSWVVLSLKLPVAVNCCVAF